MPKRNTTNNQQQSITSFFGDNAKVYKKKRTTKPIESFFPTKKGAKQATPEKNDDGNDIQEKPVSTTKLRSKKKVVVEEELEEESDVQDQEVVGKKKVKNIDEDDIVESKSEENDNDDASIDLMDTSDEEEEEITTNIKKKRINKSTVWSKKRSKGTAANNKIKSSENKRRRVIDDDDDDEDDEEDDDAKDKKMTEMKKVIPTPTTKEPAKDEKEDLVEDIISDNNDDDNDDESDYSPDQAEEKDAEHDDEMSEENPVSNEDKDEEEDTSTLRSLATNTTKSKSKSKRSKKNTTKPKEAKTINSVLKDTSSKSKGKKATNNNSKKKSSTFANATSSNEKLLEDPQIQKWKDGTPIPYLLLCKTLTEIEAITSRLEIQKLLTTLLRQCLLKKQSEDSSSSSSSSSSSPQCKNAPSSLHQDLLTLIYLSSNTVAPAYECVELGVGDAILIKAICEASGCLPAAIKQKYESEGDLGSVAMNAKGRQRTLVGFGVKPKPLMAKEVLDVFRQIATTSGAQSQKWKVDKIKGLLVRASDGMEARYIIRGLQGKLRIGLAQSTVLVSLAHAVLHSGSIVQHQNDDSDDDDNKEDKKEVLSKDCLTVKNSKAPIDEKLESAVNIVKKAYCEVSSFDALVQALVSVPLYKLHIACTLRPGLPVEPMLAKPTKSIQEVLKRLDGKRFTCEYKYDGERAQVHMSSDGVTKVFSRSLLDTSEKFPEVPLYTKEACADSNVTSFVLDTEVVAYNRETNQFVPFQVLSTRKKTENSEDDAKVKVIVQAFDLMFLNGKSLLDRTLSERRELMKKHFNAVDGKFQFATALDHTEDGDTTMLEEFLDTAVKNQCEGLMVKTLDENASYQPSKRSLNWLKLKKDYLEGMGDSVDLVPIGAFHGRGKRTGFYGAYLLACYDIDTEEFQSVCKIGTGFSDEDLKSLSEGLNKHIIPEKSSQFNVSSSLDCDVWFEACQVWEIKAADLSKSSTHKGAVDKTGETGRGIGLRFPRFERLRDDKKPENATSSDQILEMYYAQDSIVDNQGGNDDDGI